MGLVKVLELPKIEGGWGTVITDPPWRFDDRGSRAAPDGKAFKYHTMSNEEIRAIPLSSVAAPRSHLYCWTTEVHLELALECLRGWDFTFKKALVWVKRGVTGKLQIGMGHYYRTAKELCLFATRGGCPAAVHNLPDVFEAPRTKHSQKPEQIHRWAELLSPGPRLEVFARRQVPGWTCWGDQLPEVST